MGKHYVPQQYLRGFASADDPSRIWMFDKLRRAWTQPAIKRAAQQRDYFPAVLESRLSKEIEAPGHGALGNLRLGKQLAGGERDALLYYIAVMMMRVPRRRRKGRELIPEALCAVVAEARDLFASAEPFIGSERASHLLADLARAEAKLSAEPPAEVVAQIESPWPTPDVVEALNRMVWRFGYAPLGGVRFFTSDNPAFFFEECGVGSRDGELTFPISPDLVLLGSHQGEPGTTRGLVLTLPLANEVNRRIAFGAERFVFAQRPDRWVENLAMDPEPKLISIRWQDR